MRAAVDGGRLLRRVPCNLRQVPHRGQRLLRGEVPPGGGRRADLRRRAVGHLHGARQRHPDDAKGGRLDGFFEAKACSGETSVECTSSPANR